MEMDSSFMLKQFVAIDELKPSYISSSLDEFCKVYARQGGRIKMRSPPKVLTGNFRPSQLSFFLS